MGGSRPCPKGGVKIHESPSSSSSRPPNYSNGYSAYPPAPAHPPSPSSVNDTYNNYLNAYNKYNRVNRSNSNSYSHPHQPARSDPTGRPMPAHTISYTKNQNYGGRPNSGTRYAGGGGERHEARFAPPPPSAPSSRMYHANPNAPPPPPTPNPSYLMPSNAPAPSVVAMRSRAPPSETTRTFASDRSLEYERQGAVANSFVAPPSRNVAIMPAAPASTSLVVQTTTTTVDFSKTKLSDINLDLRDYTIYDIAKLFNINLNENPFISDEDLKAANKIRLKMHPDKSRVHEKYFLFFSDAYKRLVEIADIINKCSASNTKQKTEWIEMSDEERSKDSYDAEIHELLKNTIMKGNKFNNATFNEKFEQYYGDIVQTKGYDDWFRSNNGSEEVTEKVTTKAGLNAAIEKHREKQRQLVVYKGIQEMVIPVTNCSELDDAIENYSGKGDYLTYTDLKEAHTETLIPVSEQDYQKMPKYKTVLEYQNARDSQKFDYGTKEENERKLKLKERDMMKAATELAMRHQKKLDTVKERQLGFLGELRRIANF